MIDLSSSSDPEVTLAGEVSRSLTAAFDGLGIDWMIIGATARSIISVGVLGEPPGRATKDVDIAIAIAGWETFEAAARRLAADGLRRGQHTFEIAGAQVDVVPFGGVESSERIVTLPNAHELNVVGLREAIVDPLHVRLPGPVQVKVPGIPAQALLKLIAWHDRRSRVGARDAVDLATIMQWYLSGPFEADIYDSAYAELLALSNFDPRSAGSRRLGRDIAALVSGEAYREVIGILADVSLRELLANDMGGEFNERLSELDALQQGLLDADGGVVEGS